MRTLLWVTAATMVAFGAIVSLDPTSELSAQDNRPGVGVLPFVNGGSYGDEPEDYDRLQFGVQQLLMTELSFSSDLRMVERGSLRDLMAEQDLAPDRVDARSAAAIGNIVGARFMILGGFVDLQGAFRLDARVVDTETTEILFARRAQGDREDLFDLIGELAGQLAEAADFPALPESASSPEPETQVGSADEELPWVAMKRYSVVVSLRDQGRNEEADQALNALVDDFPGIVRHAQALEQSG